VGVYGFSSGRNLDELSKLYQEVLNRDKIDQSVRLRVTALDASERPLVSRTFRPRVVRPRPG
jgi:hypothetical protein